MCKEVFDLKLNQLLLLCLSVVITINITVCTASAVNQLEIGDSSQSLPDASCHITLKFKPISFTLSHHAYVVCEKIGPSGKRTLKGYRGGPSGMNDYDKVPDGTPAYPNNPPPCGDWGLFDGAHGPIDTYTAPYNEHFPDYEGDEHKVPPTADFSAELCDICDCIESVLAAIEGCCIAYELWGPNSNTIIYMALSQCMQGGTDPPLDSIRDLLNVNPDGWGSNKEIHDCIKSVY